jgi:eukaryotic-like serine/threonine-protein kinase
LEGHRSRLQVSDILSNRYQIIDILGRGGMGTVYLAEDLKLRGKQWAIKETILENHDFQRFIDEAKILVQLNHPYLPNVIDYIQPDEQGTSYLVMDFIKGHTLQHIFDQKNRRMDSKTIVKYALQICELFEYLHHGQSTPIIYRDLKPSNIMVDENDNVRIIDFGIARSFKEGKQTDTVQLGTIGFAAPEQFEEQQTDHRTDLYTLGAVMYYLLSRGKYYYVTQKRLDEIESNVPQDLTLIINKLLRKSPYDRYQRASDVKRDLQRIALGGIVDHFKDNQSTISKHHIGPVIVAVTGVYSGAGTTHTALMIANYLAYRNTKVAIVEANDSQDFARIESVYDGLKEPEYRSGKFVIHDIDYYKFDPRADLVSLLLEAYTYIVLDIGCYIENKWFEEFVRAHHQIVVASGSEWRQHELIKFHKSYPYTVQNRCIYAIPFAQEQTIKDIQRDITTSQVISIPCHSDPFAMNQAIADLLEPMLTMLSSEKPPKSVLQKAIKLSLIISSALFIMIIISVLMK